jgi:hypothetical protein
LARKMEFVPSARFDGPSPGFAFKRDQMGLGYYSDPIQAPIQAPARQPRNGRVNFLAQLEQVEAQDEPLYNMPTGARPPRQQFPPQQQRMQQEQQQYQGQRMQQEQQQQQLYYQERNQPPPPPQQLEKPEWARVADEGLTEARIAYGAHTHGNNQPPAGGDRRHLSEHRLMNTRSQIDFGSGYSQQQNAHSQFARRSQQPAPMKAQVDQIKAAGGRSNLAGPSTTNGTRRFQTGNFVLS